MMALRQAIRAVWTRPHLSLVAVALLALGMGANTTLFALADAVMFRRFPFADQDRLLTGGLLVRVQPEEPIFSRSWRRRPIRDLDNSEQFRSDSIRG